MGAVAAYARTFFDVLDHLDHADWVLFTAIGYHPANRLTDDDGVLLKALGYHGGPRVVDVLLDPFLDQARPERPDQVGTFAAGHVRDLLLRKLVVGVLTLSVDAVTAPKLLRLYARLLQSERKLQARPPADAILTHVAALREGLSAPLSGG